jgi:peptidyl-prolyl cis-trans isomerase C
MKKRMFSALAGLALSLVVVAPVLADSAPKPAPKAEDPVVARVGGGEIRRSDVFEMYQRLPAQYQQVPFEAVFAPLLEQVIDSKLLAGAGYKAKLNQTPEVKAEVAKAEERAVERLYLRQAVDVRLTKASIDEAYQKFAAAYQPRDEVKAAHILVETEAEAKTIIAELAKGGDFAKIAKEKSKDPGTAVAGGDLGYFPADAMVEPFAKAAFAMQKGEISKTPVKTEYGWHVIKLEDRRPTPVPTLEEKRPQLEQQLRESLIEGVLQQLRKEAKIEIVHSEDAAPKK